MIYKSNSLLLLHSLSTVRQKENVALLTPSKQQNKVFPNVLVI